MTPTVRLYNEDCVTGMASMLEPESVDFNITSIPFGALFMYSGKAEDIGNNADGADLRADAFGLHMRYAVEQTHRVMRPGTVVCVHVQQLRATQVQHGYIGRRNFLAAAVDLFTAPMRIEECRNCHRLVPPSMPFCGWCGDQQNVQVLQAQPERYFDHVGEFVIRKNPQLVAKREQVHSLMFETGRRDACRLAPTCNDYVLVFRKAGDRAVPVRALYDATRPGWNRGGWVSLDEWVRDAHGVWTDIRETDVLEARPSKEDGDEKHVCPLQLTVVRRCVRLYTNPGDHVLDQFCGIGTSPVVAIEPRTELATGRELPGCDFTGFELKESYHAKSVRYVAAAQAGTLDTAAPEQFEMMGEAA